MSEAEPVMYLVFRTDLGMSRGKVAAQAGHAVQLQIRHVEEDGDRIADLAAWERGSYAKVALAVDGAEAMGRLLHDLEMAGVLHAEVIDEGRTEVPAKTITCVAAGPVPKRSVACLNALGLLR